MITIAIIAAFLSMCICATEKQPAMLACIDPLMQNYASDKSIPLDEIMKRESSESKKIYLTQGIKDKKVTARTREDNAVIKILRSFVKNSPELIFNNKKIDSETKFSLLLESVKQNKPLMLSWEILEDIFTTHYHKYSNQPSIKKEIAGVSFYYRLLHNQYDMIKEIAEVDDTSIHYMLELYPYNDSMIKAQQLFNHFSEKKIYAGASYCLIRVLSAASCITIETPQANQFVNVARDYMQEIANIGKPIRPQEKGILKTAEKLLSKDSSALIKACFFNTRGTIEKNKSYFTKSIDALDQKSLTTQEKIALIVARYNIDQDDIKNEATKELFQCMNEKLTAFEMDKCMQSTCMTHYMTEAYETYKAAFKNEPLSQSIRNDCAKIADLYLGYYRMIYDKTKNSKDEIDIKLKEEAIQEIIDSGDLRIKLTPTTDIQHFEHMKKMIEFCNEIGQTEKANYYFNAMEKKTKILRNTKKLIIDAVKNKMHLLQETTAKKSIGVLTDHFQKKWTTSQKKSPLELAIAKHKNPEESTK